MGREAQVFTIFGMMTQLDEGKIFLEDEDAHIELNLEAVVKRIPHKFLIKLLTTSPFYWQTFGSGLFTDGAYVIVTGIYGEDQIFQGQSIGFPPAEPRPMTE